MNTLFTMTVRLRSTIVPVVYEIRCVRLVSEAGLCYLFRCDHVYSFLCLGGEPVPVVIRWS